MHNQLKNQFVLAACVCLCIYTPLNKSRLTADLISRKQDLICVMISLRKTCEHTNWLSLLSLSSPLLLFFPSPALLSSPSPSVCHESTSGIKKIIWLFIKWKKEQRNVITQALLISAILTALSQWALSFPSAWEEQRKGSVALVCLCLRMLFFPPRVLASWINLKAMTLHFSVFEGNDVSPSKHSQGLCVSLWSLWSLTWNSSV